MHMLRALVGLMACIHTGWHEYIQACRLAGRWNTDWLWNIKTQNIQQRYSVNTANWIFG